MHILIEKIDKDLDDDFIQIENTVQILRENLRDVAKENTRWIKTFKNSNLNAKKTGGWFDLECKTMKKAVNDYRKNYQQALKFMYEK